MDNIPIIYYIEQLTEGHIILIHIIFQTRIFPITTK